LIRGDSSRDVATLLRDERRIPMRDDDLIRLACSQRSEDSPVPAQPSSWLPRFVIDPDEDDLGPNGAIAITIASPAVAHREASVGRRHVVGGTAAR